MMKLVDVPDSKSGVLWDVWVRAPLSALKNEKQGFYTIETFYFICYILYTSRD